MTISSKLQKLKAPFPWFGGKRRVADVVWRRFGDVSNYIEPFAGSLAVMLGRPTTPSIETVNDADRYLANFWRAVHDDPERVAYYADWPVNDADLLARHRWLCSYAKILIEALECDPDFYNAKVAGWWVWGIGAWIGAGWCAGEWWGPRDERSVVGKTRPNLSNNQGVHQTRNIPRRKPHFKGAKGIHQANGQSVGRGINGHKLPPVNDLKGVHNGDSIIDWMHALADRLRRVRVLCGDWSRVVTPSVLRSTGKTGVFLDPPYAADREKCYSADSFTVADDVRAWCERNGCDLRFRIALCGYEGEHESLEALGWKIFAWKATGGYANIHENSAKGNSNARKERIWFSPACAGGQQEMF